MKYNAVIDTNVIISSMLKHDSPPGRIIDCLVEGNIVPILNQEILDEYKEVLSRGRFGFAAGDINELITLLEETGIFVERTTTDESLPDSDDVVFYETVMTARKNEDAFLVTGNIKHFPKKKFVVTPRELMDIMAT